MTDLKNKEKKYANIPKALPRITSQTSTWIVYDTVNQESSLRPLIERLADAQTVSLRGEAPQYKLDHTQLESLALKHKQDLISAWFFMKPTDRAIFRKRYYALFRILGLYQWIDGEIAAQTDHLKRIIVANDHAGISQIALTAGRRRGIETVYVQHASVSDRFPPLHASIALLDGQDARDKYAAAGPSDTKVHLVGSAKYDAYLSDPQISVLGEKVAICIGHVDVDHADFKALCTALDKNQTPFCIRFHPAVGDEIRKSYAAHGWEISQPETESALDLIVRCHTIVSADSNILLEAILLHRRPIYLSHSQRIFDYYGFLKNGVVERATYNWREVLDLLEKPFTAEPFRRAAKVYQDTLYTDFEGRSGELMRGVLSIDNG